MEIARVNITKSYSANIENTKTQKYTKTNKKYIFRIGSLTYVQFFTSYRATRYFMLLIAQGVPT